MNPTRTAAIPVLFAVVCMLLPGALSASVFLGEDRYLVAPGDTIDDDIYIGTNEAAIDGMVTGDVFLACRKYSLSGDILGSFNSASQLSTVRGAVGNSARIFAQTVTLDGSIENNFIAFGSIIDLSESSRVGKDATIHGGDVSLSGEIGRLAYIRCEQLFVSGTIGGDLDIEAEKISIVPPAEILGDIVYRSKNEINISDGVTVGGEIERKELECDRADKDDGGINLLLRSMLFLASFVTGLLMIGLTNRHARAAATQILSKPLMSLGIGFVAFCAIPIAIVVLLILIVGIPAGIILMFAYTVFFYIAKIYVAIAVGRLIIGVLRRGAEPKQGWALLLGLTILTLLFMIPVLGWIVYFLVLFWGFGAILMGIRECRWPPQPAVSGSGGTAPAPPPPISE